MRWTITRRIWLDKASRLDLAQILDLLGDLLDISVGEIAGTQKCRLPDGPGEEVLLIKIGRRRGVAADFGFRGHPSKLTIWWHFGSCVVGCKQRGVAAGGRGVDGNHTFLGEAVQRGRAAGFRAGAGEAAAAEGLHAHHGADLVAVDIGVADAQARGDALLGGLDAGVDAECQAVAGGVDRIEQVIEAVGAETRDVQDGAEDFPLQGAGIGEGERAGGDEGAVCAVMAAGAR